MSKPAVTIDVAAAMRLGYSVRSGDELVLVEVLVLAAVELNEDEALPVPPRMPERGNGIVLVSE